MKIDNSVKITGMIVVAVVVLALIGGSVFDKFSPGETVTVQGVSTVSVVPDEVSIYFNVETKGLTAKIAKDSNAEIVQDVKNALRGAGFADDAVSTQNFNVYEEYDWDDGNREFLGYKASHGIVLKLSTENDNLIGNAIDAGIDGGAMLGYINFGLSTELENEYTAEAMKLAAQDARIKAGAVAEGLGLKVGNVVSTSSSDFGYYPRMAYDNSLKMESVSGSSVATDIEVGEQEVTSRISVTYKLK